MQKNTKKKLFVVAVAVCLIAILSFSTLAWFSDSQSVENDFHLSDDEDTPEEIFSIGVWEPVDEDGDGHIDEDEKKPGKDYIDILPGGIYAKQPSVENTGSYDAYIRMTVTVSDAQAWFEVLDQYFDLDTYDLSNMFLGHSEAAWTRYEAGVRNTTDDTYSMTYYLNYALEPGEEAFLFTYVQLPGELTQNDMAKLGGNFQIVVKADAVQTENMGASNAYEAFRILEQSGQDINQIPDPTQGQNP